MSFDLLLTTEAVCLDKHPGDPDAKVVPCTSEKAAYQMAAKGTPIAAADAERLGIKTEKADATNYTLRLDSHTIARTPEEKAFALTQPQPGLVLAQAEAIRASAALSVAALSTQANAQQAEATAEAKKTDDAADKKIKASLKTKADKPARKSTRKATKKAEKKADAKADAASAPAA